MNVIRMSTEQKKIDETQGAIELFRFEKRIMLAINP
jgi:hypothetical protein